MLGEPMGFGRAVYWGGSQPWSERNRLSSLAGNFAASFEYDPFGHRLGKTIDGTTTDFLYAGANPVQELSGTTVTANLLTGLGVDEYFTRTDATGTSDFLADALGSTIGLADPNGTVQTQYTYDPFGGTTGQGAANANSLQFTGRENDGDWLYCLRARFYSPTLYRFLSQDPAWSATGGVNLYAYVGDSSANFKDPLGMLAIDPTFPASCLPALKRAIEIVRHSAETNRKCNCQFKQFGQGRSLLQLLNSPHTPFTTAQCKSHHQHTRGLARRRPTLIRGTHMTSGWTPMLAVWDDGQRRRLWCTN